LTRHLLYWLEALGLLGWISESIGMVDDLLGLLDVRCCFAIVSYKYTNLVTYRKMEATRSRRFFPIPSGSSEVTALSSTDGLFRSIRLSCLRQRRASSEGHSEINFPSGLLYRQKLS
jgi:hypothetical protein